MISLLKKRFYIIKPLLTAIFVQSNYNKKKICNKIRLMNGVVGASGLCYDSAITKEDVNETKNCTLKCFNGTTHLCDQ